MNSTMTASTSASSAYFASEDVQVLPPNSGGEDVEAQQFEEVLDRHVEQKQPQDKKSSSDASQTEEPVSSEETGTALDSNQETEMLELGAAALMAAAVIPVVDEEEVSPELNLLLESAQKISTDEEPKELAADITDVPQDQTQVFQEGVTKVLSTDTGKGENKKKVSNATSALESSKEASMPKSEFEEVFENAEATFVNDTPMMSASSSNVSAELNFSQKTVWSGVVAEDKGIEGLSDKKYSEAQSQQNISSTEMTHGTNGNGVQQGVLNHVKAEQNQWESITPTPVTKSTAVQLISQAANTSEMSLPRRLEISLKTPEGAVVHVYLQESKGGVRAQLSTNDNETLKWLSQQIPALKDMQSGDSNIRWLPPQMESQNEQQKGFLNQQNQQSEKNDQQASENPEKDAVDFAKILEKPL